MEEKSYIGGVVSGLKSLGTGLKTTMREFFTPKITEQYPENRDSNKMFERFRGSLTMPITSRMSTSAWVADSARWLALTAVSR